LNGNLGRNAGTRPNTVFTDMRIAKTISFSDKARLEGIVDMFNFINRFNVADVNSLYTAAGTPTAAFDPRQFQFRLRLGREIPGSNHRARGFPGAVFSPLVGK